MPSTSTSSALRKVAPTEPTEAPAPKAEEGVVIDAAPPKPEPEVETEKPKKKKGFFR